jgi:hypothetical protein
MAVLAAVNISSGLPVATVGVADVMLDGLAAGVRGTVAGDVLEPGDVARFAGSRDPR